MTSTNDCSDKILAEPKCLFLGGIKIGGSPQFSGVWASPKFCRRQKEKKRKRPSAERGESSLRWEENKNFLPIFEAKDFNSSTYLDSKKIFEEDIFYIVNIWASWCVPCRKEHPLLMELSKNDSTKLIGLNYKDNFNNAKKFIDRFGNPYSQILIDSDGTLSIEFGAYGVPETFIIDKNNKIIRKFIGPINKKIVEEIKLIIK